MRLQGPAADTAQVITEACAAARAVAAPAGFGPRLQAEAPDPLLAGITCAAGMAEMLVALKLPKPGTGSHAARRGRASTGLAPTRATLLGG
jgi:hypothetical protein